jgi:cation transport ATPase
MIARITSPVEKGKARKMDISKLTHGIKLVLGATIAFLIVSIFNWQEVEILDFASAGVSMWHGWGVLAGLLAIVIIVWEGIRLANVKLEIGLTPSMVTAALAILLLVFTVLKFLVDNEFRTFWAWLGLILAVLVCVGAWMNMRALGESVGEMGSSMKAAAGSAAAAAKAATDKGADAAPPAQPEAPAAPEPPSAPASPAAPPVAEAPAAAAEEAAEGQSNPPA